MVVMGTVAAEGIYEHMTTCDHGKNSPTIAGRILTPCVLFPHIQKLSLPKPAEGQEEEPWETGKQGVGGGNQEKEA